jgi:cytochrome c oxidase cbb3-type subunit 4
MDINDMRSIVTVLTFVVFVGIVLWALSGRRRAGFEEAALLPFTEDEGLKADRGGAASVQFKELEGKA